MRLLVARQPVMAGNPPNRSILVGGGKEINRDTVSKGDRTRYRANRIPPEMEGRCGVADPVTSSLTDSNPLRKVRAVEGESPVEESQRDDLGYLEYHALDIAWEVGRHILPTLNTT